MLQKKPAHEAPVGINSTIYQSYHLLPRPEAAGFPSAGNGGHMPADWNQ